MGDAEEGFDVLLLIMLKADLLETVPTRVLILRTFLTASDIFQKADLRITDGLSLFL